MIDTAPIKPGEMTNDEVEGNGEGAVAPAPNPVVASFDGEVEVVVDCFAVASFVSPSAVGGVEVLSFSSFAATSFIVVSAGVVVEPEASSPPAAAATVELLLTAGFIVSPPIEGCSSLGGRGERIERAVM